jgi:hypothetical protein
MIGDQCRISSLIDVLVGYDVSDCVLIVLIRGSKVGELRESPLRAGILIDKVEVASLKGVVKNIGRRLGEATAILAGLGREDEPKMCRFCLIKGGMYSSLLMSHCCQICTPKQLFQIDL